MSNLQIDIGSLTPFGIQDELIVFLGEHAFQHLVIAQTVAQTKGIQVVHFPINDVGDPKIWMNDHSLIHSSIAAAIGIGQNPDLADYDLQQEDQYYDWMQYHASIHDEIAQVLGLG